jgi:hypothetical protein
MDKSYLQFALADQSAMLINVMVKGEHKSANNVPKTYLFFEVDLPNTDLAYLHPQLRNALYAKGDGKGAQADLDENHLAHYKFAEIGRLPVDKTITGARLTFHTATERGNTELDAEKVDRFTIECKDGGTVRWRFRCVTSAGDAERGKITGMLRKQVTISLTPPTAEDEAEAAAAAQQHAEAVAPGATQRRSNRNQQQAAH